jgi:ABC-type nitrate/sulfonate/bicarbonate transport system ATPase subunit
MLSVDIKHKSRGGAAVIRDLSLAVAPGETLALVGPSGCGKTSAMRILAGLDDDFEGERRCPDGARLAMAFQEPRLLPWRSVRDNVALALPEQERDAAKVTAALQAVGVAEAGDLFPGQLSLGMARRASLARALVSAPDYLLLDEPFVSLDEATAARMRGLLADLLDRTRSGVMQAGVVLVTHDLREAGALADRVLLLSPRPATVMREHRIDAPRARRDNDFIEDLRLRLLQPCSGQPLP